MRDNSDVYIIGRELLFTAIYARRAYLNSRRDVLPSAIDRLLLSALDFGTVQLSMFSLLHNLQHFAES